MGKPKYPDPPDYAAANREAIMADIETLPIRKEIEAAASLGLSGSYVDPDTGEERAYDFSGFSDVDQQRELLDFAKESAAELAQTELDIRREFGSQYVEQSLAELEQSDPIGFEIRKQLGEEALKELGLGYDLGDELTNQIQQGVRGAQAARGNLFGSAPVAEEAFAIGDAAVRLRQQRLGNAASFLQGVTPVAQFSQISGAQAGANPFNPMMPQQGIGLNPNAGAQGTQFALGRYQQQSNNATNAAAGGIGQTLLGAVGGVAFSGLTGGLGGALTGAGFQQGAGEALGGMFR